MEDLSSSKAVASHPSGESSPSSLGFLALQFSPAHAPSPAFEASLWQSSEGLMSSSICSNPLVNYLDVRTKEMAKVTDWVSRGGTA